MRLPQSESTSADALNSGSAQLAGFFCGESPDLAAAGGFYSNARREVCVLTGRPEGALWSSGTAASAAESSAGRVGLASPYSPFLGEIPPPRPAERTERGRRGAWGGGGTGGGKSMRAHGTKAIRRAGGEPAEGIGWEMKAGAEPGFH